MRYFVFLAFLSLPAQGKTLLVSKPSEIIELRLNPTSPAAKLYQRQMLRYLYEGLKTNNYQFLLTASERRADEDALYLGKDHKLSQIMRISKSEGACSTIYPVNEEMIGAGAGLKTLTKGICGPIATLHSIAKLKLAQQDKLYKSGKIKENAIKWVQKHQREPNSMTEKELIQAHKAAGAGYCKVSSGSACSNKFILDRFNRQLAGYMSDRKHTWDCSLFVRAKDQRGKWNLAHIEHVTKVTLRPSGSEAHAKIETINGLDQGNQKSTVPAHGGTNVWQTNPGTANACSFVSSSHRDNASYKQQIQKVQFINFVCCRKP